jgi:hypothetical protein
MHMRYRSRNPRHVLLDCPDEEERRESLRKTQEGNLGPRKLLDTRKGHGKPVSGWLNQDKSLNSGLQANFCTGMESK